MPVYVSRVFEHDTVVCGRHIFNNLFKHKDLRQHTNIFLRHMPESRPVYKTLDLPTYLTSSN